MTSLTTAVPAILIGVALAGLAFAQQTQPKPDEPAEEKPAESEMVYVLMKTTMGDMVLELNRAKAPVTVRNFITYADRQFYHGTIFHRVVPGFVIQGGGFTADMSRKPTDDAIINEWQNGLENERGTLAMARTTAPNSATSQFFINLKDNSNLDQPISGGAGYAVFGKVVAGMDVVDAIAAVPTGSRGGMQNVPAEPVVIQEVRQLTADQAKRRIEMDKKPKESGGDNEG